ncbi:hypothetical protein FWH30_02985 [Microgenomates group bacterium]|nr:hypothetical protein [Microgenomates group bacterium]
MSKKIIFLISLILTLFICALPLYAQEDADLEATESGDVQKRNPTLLDNLEKITRQIESNAQLKDIYTDLNIKKRGFIAQVTNIRDKTIRVRDLNDSEQFLTFDKSTVIIRKGQESSADQIALDEWMEIDDWIVVIGVEEDSQFFPRRILISSTSLLPKEKIVKLGTLGLITSAKLSYLPQGTDTMEEIKITRQTTFQDQDAQAIKSTDLNSDTPILVVGYQDNTGQTATTIRAL